MIRTIKALSLTTLILGLVCCVDQPIQSGDVLIEDVNIVDVLTGRIILNQDVLLQADSIAAIFDHKEKTIHAKTKIEGDGMYLIPGLWDMHVHLTDLTDLDLYARFGIVGVRDMGGNAPHITNGCESIKADHVLEWKSKIEKGEIYGPEIIFSGPAFSGTGWPTSLPARSYTDIETSFEQWQRYGADFIKIYDAIPMTVYLVLTDKAKAAHVQFAGHIPESVLLSQTSDAGQRSIEHIPEPLLLCFTNNQAALDSFMRADHYSKDDRQFVSRWINDCDAAIAAFKKNKTWLTPTLSVEKSKVRYLDSAWLNHKLRERMPASVNDSFKSYVIRKSSLSSKDKQSEILWWTTQKRLLKRMHENGIGILAGTDSSCEGGMPGYSLHEELELMVEAGLSPIAALRTATINPAKFFGKSSRSGSIGKGKHADLILLKENPLINIANTKSIQAVFINGKQLRK